MIFPPVHAESNGHRWHWVQYARARLECCAACGIVRRRDDKNSQCKGPTKVKTRP